MSKRYAFLLFIALELLLLTYLRAKLGHHASSILLFISSIAAPILLARVYLDREPSSKQGISKPLLFGSYAVFFGITTACFVTVTEIFKNYEINPKWSDIIPHIQVIIKRLIDGEFPYTPIDVWGWEMFPNYLPLHWAPFTITTLLDKDPRWVSFGMLMIAILVFAIYQIFKRKNKWFPVVLLFPIVALYFLLQKDGGTFGMTIEPLIAGYYLLLALSLFSSSPLIRGLALSLCLFSRYAVVLWVPLYLFVVWMKEGKKNAILIAGYSFIVFLLTYGIPFLWKDPTIFQKGFAYYAKGILGEWNHLNDVGNPYHLFRGIGFAGAFYEYLPGDKEALLGIVQKVHLIASGMAVGIPLLLWWTKLKDRIDYKIFLLVSLKIYLVVFFTFVQIPYAYLFLTPLFVSTVLVWKMLSPVEKGNQLVVD